MAIIEIKKNNIGEQVYTQMRNQILNGDWKPGDKIPSENQLMTLFGVSRGTVRQAVQRLAGEGMVLTRQGEGSFVQTVGLDNYFQLNGPTFTPTVEELEKIFEFRSIFESGVAEVAAEKATKEHIDRLTENCERLKQETDMLNQFVHTDLEFHLLLCECAQNTMAIQIFNSYECLLEPSILRMTQTIGAGNGLKYHALILDAVRNHDPERARMYMQEHMKDNMARFRQLRAQENVTEPLS